MLVTFDAVCRTRNTSKAADLIGLTQPAVSRHLKQLREITGQELFIRTHDGLHPTEAGQDLWQCAVDILDAGHRFQNYSQEQFNPEEEEKTFTIAVSLINSDYFVEKLLLAVNKRYPKITVNIINLHMARAIERLDDREIDLYVGFKPDNVPSNLNALFLDSYPFCVMCSDRSSLYSEGKVQREDFINTPHLKVYTDTKETYLDSYLSAHNLFQKTFIDLPDVAAVPIVLKENSYLFLASEQQAENFMTQYKGLKVLSADFQLPVFEAYMFWHKAQDTENAHNWLRSFVTSQLS